MDGHKQPQSWDLMQQLNLLCSEMLSPDNAETIRSAGVRADHLPSASNLMHYLALRSHDIRELQAQLAALGLSSLGRTEPHVIGALQAVMEALHQLSGSAATLFSPPAGAPEIGQGAEFLKRHAEALLGVPPEGRNVRIMVTMPSEAATDYELVRDLVRCGMDCMRINCAHDGPTEWGRMIRNLRRAEQETGKSCKVAMDLAGPKLRTGPVEAGPKVLKYRPKRDELGRVVEPARVWLAPEHEPQRAPRPSDATIPMPAEWLRARRPHELVKFLDARGAKRELRITGIEGTSCWAEAKQTAYVIPGLEFLAEDEEGKAVPQAPRRGRVGDIPSRVQTLLLRKGDTLVLTRAAGPGSPALYDGTNQLIRPAYIGVTLPEFFECVRAGEPIWLDDGKIGGVIREVSTDKVAIEITHTRPTGEKLAAEKGINVPGSALRTPSLTTEDLLALEFIVKHADIIGYSFVRSEADVRELQERLRELGGEHLGIILKIETREGFNQLPNLLLAAMRSRAVGVMIARGDLAIECGFQRLAEVQEEILWICEAAHMPVIWATQVLESLAKTGMPSRSEITDAAMGERAECVMLNKGPYVVTAVRILDDILRRMQTHQDKKRSMLRKLRVASVFRNAGRE
jgi:pyruvate kinase